MLAQLTAATDWLAMSLALWLAAYLFIRSHFSRTTWRAVIVLAALAAAFLLAYVGQGRGSYWLANAWAAALTLAIVGFSELTYHWLAPAQQRAWRWGRWAIVALGALKIVYVLVLPADAGLAASSGLATQPWQPTALALADGVYLLLALGSGVNHLRLARRAGDRPHYRLMLIAAWLALAGYVEGALAVQWPAIFPRIGQDLLLIAALGVLGYAIARYQAFIGRRTTLHDFPVSAATVLGLAALYGLIANGYGFAAEQVVLVTALAILTHSGYDLVREFLDRLLHQRETALRAELRSLTQAVQANTSLAENLQQALESAAALLNASGAFVAQRDGAAYVVVASFRSLAVGAALPAADLTAADTREAGLLLPERLSWVAPVHVGLEQVAVVGIGPRVGGAGYASADLDVITEVADWISRMVEADRALQESLKQVQVVMADAAGLPAPELPETFLARIQQTPERAFVRMVEDALRHAAEYARLGASPLTTQLGLAEGTHIERGKLLRAALLDAVEALRPAGPRPSGVPPKEWYSYVILYDAYVEDVPNREIQARLYIGEGTFNRLRRSALQAVSRALLERHPGPAGATPPVPATPETASLAG